MIDCPLCKEKFETGHAALEHCKEAHPELYQHIKDKTPSLIEVNKLIAMEPAVDMKPLPGIEIKQLPGTKGVQYIEEPPSLALAYILLAATTVIVFTMILLSS